MSRSRSGVLLTGSVGGFAERRERGAPELLEVVADGGEPGGIDGVDAPGAVGVVTHQPGVLQHLEVLAHRRPAHRQLPGELPHGARRPGDACEDRASGRIGERRQSRKMVSRGVT